MRVLLINPSCAREAGRDLYSAQVLGPLFTMQLGKRMTLGIPLALPTLAAYTPPEHAVTIIDEEIEEIDFDEPVDLVGITAMTFKATRAYEIAREFRARGVRVVMGGIHATMSPDEAAEHVDCVVTGEAEDLWPLILEDAARGNLKSRYGATGLSDMSRSLIPRYELVKNSQYLYTYLQTTRGCPHDCNFCTVTKMSGRKIRKKSPEQVVREVDALFQLKPRRQQTVIDRPTGTKKQLVGMVALIDDNFAIDRRHALAVCRALTRYQEERNIAIMWYTQVNYEVGFDAELLEAMSRANCQHLFIGFESLDPETLEAMNKKFNTPKRYADAIRNIQEHGMRVIFSTIIGDDNCDQKAVTYLRNFIKENNIMHALLNIMTPYRGTDLYESMNNAGRITTREPHRYNIRNVVFEPAKTTAGELLELYGSLCQDLYRYDQVYQRGKRLSGIRNRLGLPLGGRILAWLGFSYVSLALAMKGDLRWKIAGILLAAAPRHILFDESLYGLELLVTSADYDDFAHSEAERFRKGIV